MPSNNTINNASSLTHAVFAQDEDSGISVAPIENIVHTKQIWLLEGSFTQAEGQKWADNIARGQLTKISANIMVMVIDSITWPEIHTCLGPGLSILTYQEHTAIANALSEICEGRVDCGQRILRDAGICLAQPQ